MACMPIEKGPTMPPKQPTAGWFQTEILKSLQEVKDKVDESLELGRQNGEAIRSLRTELGVDGLHGRIPQLEQAIARLDRQQEADNKGIISRIETLERGEHENKGRKQFVLILLSLLGGSASGAVITIVYHLLQPGITH